MRFEISGGPVGWEVADWLTFDLLVAEVTVAAEDMIPLEIEIEHFAAMWQRTAAAPGDILQEAVYVIPWAAALSVHYSRTLQH